MTVIINNELNADMPNDCINIFKENQRALNLLTFVFFYFKCSIYTFNYYKKRSHLLFNCKDQFYHKNIIYVNIIVNTMLIETSIVC
jgi:hypothetical protein